MVRYECIDLLLLIGMMMMKMMMMMMMMMMKCGKKSEREANFGSDIFTRGGTSMVVF